MDSLSQKVEELNRKLKEAGILLEKKPEEVQVVFFRKKPKKRAANKHNGS